MKQLGIIGAGAAGICALRHALATSGLKPVLWEHSTTVGGTWVFTPETETDQYKFPIHSSMYNSLRTNLPKEIMCFPDFPFKNGNESFIHHTEVLKYLNEYTDHFHLKPWIKFEHHVNSVERIKGENGTTLWKVEVENLKDKSIQTLVFDGILICNGHYSVPSIPKIKRIEAFSGTKIHSHQYRYPEPFKYRNVVVLGAASSGKDISLEVATITNKVYLSHNFPVPIPSKLPNNVVQVRGIAEATENGFILLDRTHIEVDDIIFCTGYEYHFPFLRPSCEVEVIDNYIKPLYKHIIHSSYPSLGFIGMAFKVLPFPLFDMQICFYLATLIGEIILPSKAAMDAETLADCDAMLSRGIYHFHELGDLQWDYVDELAKMTNLPLRPRVIEKIYKDVHFRKQMNLTTYKETIYSIVDSSNFDVFNSIN